MNEKIKAFLLKVEEDKELQAKLSQIRNPEEAYQLASGLVDGLTKEEFMAEMTKMYENQMQDLSDDDLAVIAGGCSDEVLENASAISGGVSLVTAAAAAFAA